MNIDHTRMTAELRATVCGRVSSTGRVFGAVARRAVGACVLLSTVIAMSAAHGQDRGGFRKDDLQQQQQQQQRDERSDRNERNGARQDMPRFDLRGADDRRQQQERNADAKQHSGRLTPDERRDLRRQINEAGVDLYPNTPRR